MFCQVPLRNWWKRARSGASRARDTAARSDVIITMLPDGPEVESAVLGPGGVLEGARAGSTVVDMSSISPMVSQKVGAACAEKRRGVSGRAR